MDWRKRNGEIGDDFVSEYYRAKVGAAAEEMNGGIFLNEDVYHAWYLFKVILQRAPKNKYPIRIICGQLRKDFYESLGPYADDAMKKGCSLDVYVTFRSKESLREESNQFAKCWKVAKTEIFTVTMRVRIWNLCLT